VAQQTLRAKVRVACRMELLNAASDVAFLPLQALSVREDRRGPPSPPPCVPEGVQGRARGQHWGTRAAGIALLAAAPVIAGSRRRRLRRKCLVARRAFETMQVPVRSGVCNVALKRFLAPRDLKGVPKLLPAVLVIHDGPGLPSRYLEPLAERLCVGGRACYLYDQLGCGDSRSGGAPGGVAEETGMQPSVSDLCNVLDYLSSRLGEPELHIIGHGYGGALLMEALLRQQVYARGVPGLNFPSLRSVCLLSVAGSTAALGAEAERLMQRAEAAMSTSPEEAATCFWLRHVCGLKPQPACLTEAYSESFPGLGGGRWGPLAGFYWDVGKKTEQGVAAESRWRLRGSVMEGWQMDRAEVAASYWDASGGAPLMSIRGEHDFVTAPCVEAWRGAADAAAAGGVGGAAVFSEAEIQGCSHNAHLENPDLVAAKLRLWLLKTDEGISGIRSAAVDAAAQLVAKNEAEERAVRALLGGIRPLSRDEARRILATWSSELAWEHHGARSLLSPTERRFLEQARGPGVASHLDGRSPSREAYRLASWAWGLSDEPSDGACGADGVRKALQRCVGEGCDVGPRQVAIGLTSDDHSTLLAIACVEADEIKMNRSLCIVGAAGSPECPDAKEGLVRALRRLIADVV